MDMWVALLWHAVTPALNLPPPPLSTAGRVANKEGEGEGEGGEEDLVEHPRCPTHSSSIGP